MLPIEVEKVVNNGPAMVATCELTEESLTSST